MPTDISINWLILRMMWLPEQEGGDVSVWNLASYYLERGFLQNLCKNGYKSYIMPVILHGWPESMVPDRKLDGNLKDRKIHCESNVWCDVQG